ncbi:MAG: hypothetical protein WC655_24320 [Candidatus Hydrogenedentales bacterium]|jgi:hypothetical protein
MPVSKHADERDELLALIDVSRARVSQCFSRAMKYMEAVEGDNNPTCLDDAQKELVTVARLIRALRDYQQMYRASTPGVPSNVTPV